MGNYKLDDIVTAINVHKYQRLLKILGFDPNKSKELIQGFTKGFDIGYRGPKNRQDRARNISIMVGSEQEIWDKLMSEVSAGRHAGPFTEIPYQNFIQSPVGLVHFSLII